ncbi:hypothetical protein ACJ73_08886 [Blastomyces percursus]|uniref:Uncharacterized protein n=1 Tax=Blastomyces percursus TaxID=1658174 RepID=A0A1J9PKN1_9EURO|nr:hypothetical protein ACJ73_08886 [Blastomyces percursus]
MDPCARCGRGWDGILAIKNTPSRDAKNTGRSALAIFEDPQARNAALEASPVVVPIPSLSTLFPSSYPRDSDGDHYSTKSALAKPRIKAKTKEARMNKAREKEKEQFSTSDVNQPQPSILCYIEPSYHDHGVAVKQNPYHNTFLVTSNSLEVQDLLQTANGQDSRGRYKRDGHSQSQTAPFWVGYVDCFPKKKRPVPFRHQINAMRFAESLHGDSLMRLWREGREIAKKKKLASVASEKAKEEPEESPKPEPDQ